MHCNNIIVLYTPNYVEENLYDIQNYVCGEILGFKRADKPKWFVNKTPANRSHKYSNYVTFIVEKSSEYLRTISVTNREYEELPFEEKNF